ncbi:MAG TPA: hypothetical protein VE010_14135 [Thermoanaerobaculia bacterium]|nr:hypothetical protein [Thermoanaerobaculia bacterium]
MTRAALLTVALVVAMQAAANEPAARLRADGMLIVTLQADLLAHRDVRKQVGSGLTTTFLITVTDAQNRKGAARIEVRYEPWDEVYLVTARGIDAVAQRARLETFERLTEWWRSAALPLLPAASAVSTAQLTLEVLPFSIEEQKETQRWLSRALGEAHREQPMDRSEVRGTAGGSSVLDALIGTSIQRRPILRQRWTVAVSR